MNPSNSLIPPLPSGLGFSPLDMMPPQLSSMPDHSGSSLPNYYGMMPPNSMNSMGNQMSMMGTPQSLTMTQPMAPSMVTFDASFLLNQIESKSYEIGTLKTEKDFYEKQYSALKEQFDLELAKKKTELEIESKNAQGQRNNAGSGTGKPLDFAALFKSPNEMYAAFDQYYDSRLKKRIYDEQVVQSEASVLKQLQNQQDAERSRTQHDYDKRLKELTQQLAGLQLSQQTQHVESVKANRDFEEKLSKKTQTMDDRIEKALKGASQFQPNVNSAADATMSDNQFNAKLAPTKEQWAKDMKELRERLDKMSEKQNKLNTSLTTTAQSIADKTDKKQLASQIGEAQRKMTVEYTAMVDGVKKDLSQQIATERSNIEKQLTTKQNATHEKLNQSTVQLRQELVKVTTSLQRIEKNEKIHLDSIAKLQEKSVVQQEEILRLRDATKQLTDNCHKLIEKSIQQQTLIDQLVQCIQQFSPPYNPSSQTSMHPSNPSNQPNPQHNPQHYQSNDTQSASSAPTSTSTSSPFQPQINAPADSSMRRLKKPHPTARPVQLQSSGTSTSSQTASNDQTVQLGRDNSPQSAQPSQKTANHDSTAQSTSTSTQPQSHQFQFNSNTPNPFDFHRVQRAHDEFRTARRLDQQQGTDANTLALFNAPNANIFSPFTDAPPHLRPKFPHDFSQNTQNDAERENPHNSTTLGDSLRNSSREVNAANANNQYQQQMQMHNQQQQQQLQSRSNPPQSPSSMLSLQQAIQQGALNLPQPPPPSHHLYHQFLKQYGIDFQQPGAWEQMHGGAPQSLHPGLGLNFPHPAHPNNPKNQSNQSAQTRTNSFIDTFTSPSSSSSSFPQSQPQAGSSSGGDVARRQQLQRRQQHEFQKLQQEQQELTANAAAAALTPTLRDAIAAFAFEAASDGTEAATTQQGDSNHSSKTTPDDNAADPTTTAPIPNGKIQKVIKVTKSTTQSQSDPQKDSNGDVSRTRDIAPRNKGDNATNVDDKAEELEQNTNTNTNEGSKNASNSLLTSMMNGGNELRFSQAVHRSTLPQQQQQQHTYQYPYSPAQPSQQQAPRPFATQQRLRHPTHYRSGLNNQQQPKSTLHIEVVDDQSAQHGNNNSNPNQYEPSMQSRPHDPNAQVLNPVLRLLQRGRSEDESQDPSPTTSPSSQLPFDSNQVRRNQAIFARARALIHSLLLNAPHSTTSDRKRLLNVSPPEPEVQDMPHNEQTPDAVVSEDQHNNKHSKSSTHPSQPKQESHEQSQSSPELVNSPEIIYDRFSYSPCLIRLLLEAIDAQNAAACETFLPLWHEFQADRTFREHLEEQFPDPSLKKAQKSKRIQNKARSAHHCSSSDVSEPELDRGDDDHHHHDHDDTDGQLQTVDLVDGFYFYFIYSCIPESQRDKFFTKDFHTMAGVNGVNNNTEVKPQFIDPILNLGHLNQQPQQQYSYNNPAHFGHQEQQQHQQHTQFVPSDLTSSSFTPNPNHNQLQPAQLYYYPHPQYPHYVDVPFFQPPSAPQNYPTNPLFQQQQRQRQYNQSVQMQTQPNPNGHLNLAALLSSMDQLALNPPPHSYLNPTGEHSHLQHPNQQLPHFQQVIVPGQDDLSTDPNPIYPIYACQSCLTNHHIQPNDNNTGPQSGLKIIKRDTNRQYRNQIARQLIALKRRDLVENTYCKSATSCSNTNLDGNNDSPSTDNEERKKQANSFSKTDFLNALCDDFNLKLLQIACDGDYNQSKAEDAVPTTDQPDVADGESASKTAQLHGSKHTQIIAILQSFSDQVMELIVDENKVPLHRLAVLEKFLRFFHQQDGRTTNSFNNTDYDQPDEQNDSHEEAKAPHNNASSSVYTCTGETCQSEHDREGNCLLELHLSHHTFLFNQHDQIDANTTNQDQLSQSPQPQSEQSLALSPCGCTCHRQPFSSHVQTIKSQDENCENTKNEENVPQDEAEVNSQHPQSEKYVRFWRQLLDTVQQHPAMAKTEEDYNKTESEEPEHPSHNDHSCHQDRDQDGDQTPQISSDFVISRLRYLRIKQSYIISAAFGLLDENLNNSITPDGSPHELLPVDDQAKLLKETVLFNFTSTSSSSSSPPPSPCSTDGDTTTSLPPSPSSNADHVLNSTNVTAPNTPATSSSSSISTRPYDRRLINRRLVNRHQKAQKAFSSLTQHSHSPLSSRPQSLSNPQSPPFCALTATLALFEPETTHKLTQIDTEIALLEEFLSSFTAHPQPYQFSPNLTHPSFFSAIGKKPDQPSILPVQPSFYNTMYLPLYQYPKNGSFDSTTVGLTCANPFCFDNCPSNHAPLQNGPHATPSDSTNQPNATDGFTNQQHQDSIYEKTALDLLPAHLRFSRYFQQQPQSDSHNQDEIDEMNRYLDALSKEGGNSHPSASNLSKSNPMRINPNGYGDGNASGQNDLPTDLLERELDSIDDFSAIYDDISRFAGFSDPLLMVEYYQISHDHLQHKATGGCPLHSWLVKQQVIINNTKQAFLVKQQKILDKQEYQLLVKKGDILEHQKALLVDKLHFMELARSSFLAGTLEEGLLEKVSTDIDGRILEEFGDNLKSTLDIRSKGAPMTSFSGTTDTASSNQEATDKKHVEETKHPQTESQQTDDSETSDKDVAFDQLEYYNNKIFYLNEHLDVINAKMVLFEQEKETFLNSLIASLALVESESNPQTNTTVTPGLHTEKLDADSTQAAINQERTNQTTYPNPLSAPPAKLIQSFLDLSEFFNDGIEIPDEMVDNFDEMVEMITHQSIADISIPSHLHCCPFCCAPSFMDGDEQVTHYPTSSTNQHAAPHESFFQKRLADRVARYQDRASDAIDGEVDTQLLTNNLESNQFTEFRAYNHNDDDYDYDDEEEEDLTPNFQSHVLQASSQTTIPLPSVKNESQPQDVGIHPITVGQLRKYANAMYMTNPTSPLYQALTVNFPFKFASDSNIIPHTYWNFSFNAVRLDGDAKPGPNAIPTTDELPPGLSLEICPINESPGGGTTSTYFMAVVNKYGQRITNKNAVPLYPINSTSLSGFAPYAGDIFNIFEPVEFSHFLHCIAKNEYYTDRDNLLYQLFIRSGIPHTTPQQFQQLSQLIDNNGVNIPPEGYLNPFTRNEGGSEKRRNQPMAITIYYCRLNFQPHALPHNNTITTSMHEHFYAFYPTLCHQVIASPPFTQLIVQFYERLFAETQAKKLSEGKTDSALLPPHSFMTTTWFHAFLNIFHTVVYLAGAFSLKQQPAVEMHDDYAYTKAFFMQLLGKSTNNNIASGNPFASAAPIHAVVSKDDAKNKKGSKKNNKTTPSSSPPVSFVNFVDLYLVILYFVKHLYTQAKISTPSRRHVVATHMFLSFGRQDVDCADLMTFLNCPVFIDLIFSKTNDDESSTSGSNSSNVAFPHKSPQNASQSTHSDGEKYTVYDLSQYKAFATRVCAVMTGLKYKKSALSSTTASDKRQQMIVLYGIEQFNKLQWAPIIQKILDDSKFVTHK